MNKRYKILLLVFIFTGSSMVYSQTIDSPYEVGTWRGFRSAAISYTFDDGNLNQFGIAIPMFDEFGFKLTLFTVTDWVTEKWAALQDAAANGHEIASHTITHPSLDTISKEKQEDELKNSQEAIDAKIPNHKCITLAFPNCRPGDESICEKYYIAARNCQGRIEKSTPDNFMNISSIICGNRGPLRTDEHFNSKFEETAASNGWCVLLFHGIDDDGGYSPIPSTTLKASLEYLKTNESTYWVETFLNVVRYIKERDAVSVKEISNQQDRITLQVTDTLDDAVYNYPITIRRVLPDGWSVASVSQNGKSAEATNVQIDSKKYIMFDVVPDGGDVVISKEKTPPLM